MKHFGHGQNTMVGGVGSIGQVGVGMQHQLGVRSIQSQKGIRHTQTNNLMMSQQVVGSAQLGQSSQNQSFANSQILNQQ